jgi:hypothetical protein
MTSSAKSDGWTCRIRREPAEQAEPGLGLGFAELIAGAEPAENEGDEQRPGGR